MCDLLWSDPEERPGWEGWNESPRGAGCLFGMDQVLHVRKIFYIKSLQLCTKKTMPLFLYIQPME